MRPRWPMAPLYLGLVLLFSSCLRERDNPHDPHGTKAHLDAALDLARPDLGDLGVGEQGSPELGADAAPDLPSVDLAPAPDLAGPLDLAPDLAQVLDLAVGPEEGPLPDLAVGPGLPDLAQALDLPPAPDLAQPDVGLPSCKNLFGHIDGYFLCWETPTGCRFWQDQGLFGGSYSCDHLCKPGKCLKSENTSIVNRCGVGSASKCSTKHNAHTCVCSKF